MSMFKLLELLPGTMVRSSAHGRLGVVVSAPPKYQRPVPPCGICWVIWVTKGAELLTDADLDALSDDAMPEPVRLCDVVLTGHIVTGRKKSKPPRPSNIVIDYFAEALAKAAEARGQAAEHDPHPSILESINKMFAEWQPEQAKAQPEATPESQTGGIPAEPPTPLPVYHRESQRRGVYEFDGLKDDNTVRVRWADNPMATARVHVGELTVPEANDMPLPVYLAQRGCSDCQAAATCGAKVAEASDKPRRPSVQVHSLRFDSFEELFDFIKSHG